MSVIVDMKIMKWKATGVVGILWINNTLNMTVPANMGLFI